VISTLAVYVTGYTNIAKLGGAEVVSVSCTQLQIRSHTTAFKNGALHLIGTATGNFDSSGLMQSSPSTGTFLAYGFMPATATMVLEETAPMEIISDIQLTGSPIGGHTYIRFPVIAKVTKLSINGTPVDLGSSCTTVQSLYSTDPDPAQDTHDHVVMDGYSFDAAGIKPGDYTLSGGGPLSSTVTIPPFHHCGADGEFDSILTASISGPGNYIKEIQPKYGCDGISAATNAPDTGCTADLQPTDIPQPER